MIGQLRHIITIQEPVETVDSLGQVVLSWRTVNTRYASIKILTGRELAIAKQIAPEANVVIGMRRYDGLTTRHRLVFGSKIYDITAVVNVDERNIQTLIYATISEEIFTYSSSSSRSSSSSCKSSSSSKSSRSSSNSSKSSSSSKSSGSSSSSSSSPLGLLVSGYTDWTDPWKQGTAWNGNYVYMGEYTPAWDYGPQSYSWYQKEDKIIRAEPESPSSLIWSWRLMDGMGTEWAYKSFQVGQPESSPTGIYYYRGYVSGGILIFDGALENGYVEYD